MQKQGKECLQPPGAGRRKEWTRPGPLATASLRTAGFRKGKNAFLLFETRHLWASV